MNLVGKIFTVLIFVMCLVFSSFALMLHAAHKNWYNEIVKPDGYRDQVDKLAKEKYKLQQEYAELQAEKIKGEDRYKTDITKLEAANKQLDDQVNGLVVQKEQLQGSLRKFAADFKLVEQNLNDLRDETEGLRGQIAKAIADRQGIWNQLVKATTDVNNYVAQIAQLERQMRPLAEKLQEAESVAAYTGTRKSDLNKEPPAGVSGEVMAVQQGEVEISLGYDDGIHEGQRFAVVRPSTNHYVGDIIVYKVQYPNRAVCRPDPSMMREQIQKYDHVEARITRKPR
jgi:uncharacterized protein (DUF3084 family)